MYKLDYSRGGKGIEGRMRGYGSAPLLGYRPNVMVKWTETRDTRVEGADRYFMKEDAESGLSAGDAHTFWGNIPARYPRMSRLLSTNAISL